MISTPHKKIWEQNWLDPSVTAYADLAGEAFSKDGVVATTFMCEYAVQQYKCSHYKYYLDISTHKPVTPL